MLNYYRNELSNPLSSNSESFKYKTSITGNTYNIGIAEAGYNENKVRKNKTEVVIPLKHLSSFWRTLNILLINCEIELILTSKNYVVADMTVRDAGNNNDPTSNCCTSWIRTSNKRHKIVRSSCYFVNRK